MMIEVEITKDIVDKCQHKAMKIGKLNNSITMGEGNLSGVIGEYVVLQYLEGSEWKNTYDYDLIHDDKKIDVKAEFIITATWPGDMNDDIDLSEIIWDSDDSDINDDETEASDNGIEEQMGELM